MAEKFYGLIPQEEWLDVGFQVTRPNDFLRIPLLRYNGYG